MRGLTAVVLLGVLAGAAWGQSLGEVAQREQEKKEKAPASPAPSYTEADLKAKHGKSKGTVSEMPVTGGQRTSSASPSPDPSPSASADDEASDRAIQERTWRARFREARARVAEADAQAYEDRIETVFVSGIPVQQRVRVRVETPELVAARQALLDLEDELRRAGGLPGWAREEPSLLVR
jgi:hypothetical protein